MELVSCEQSLSFWLFSDPEVVTFSAGASLINLHPNLCSPFLLHTEQVPPQGYVTFNDASCASGVIRNRDVTSPINELDVDSSSSRGKSLPQKWSSLQCSLGCESRPWLPFSLRCFLREGWDGLAIEDKAQRGHFVSLYK